MERYNYSDSVRADVLSFIRQNIVLADWKGKPDKLEEVLLNDCEIRERVSGTNNGTYFFDREEAEEALCHNWYMLKWAIDREEYTIEEAIEKGPEWCDTVIRYHIVENVLRDVIANLKARRAL